MGVEVAFSAVDFDEEGHCFYEGWVEACFYAEVGWECLVVVVGLVVVVFVGYGEEELGGCAWGDFCDCEGLDFAVERLG